MPTEIEVESHDNNSQALSSFTEIPGPKIDVSDSGHPIAFFKLVWGETTSNFLAEKQISTLHKNRAKHGQTQMAWK